MKKKSIFIIAIILAVVVIGTTYGDTYMVSFSKNTSNETEGKNFITVNVKKGDITMSASGSGNVEPSVRKEVKNLDNGNIVDRIFVEEGQQVKEGDLILTFEGDSQNSQIEQAKLDLTQHQNQLESLKEQLNDLKIYTNESGYIGDIKADTGNELSNNFLLTTITDTSHSEISGLYHQKQLEKINVGDKATVTLIDSFFTIDGMVSRINKIPIPQEDGAVLYEVIVEVENPGGISESTKGLVVINNENGAFTSLEETYFETKAPKEVRLNISGTLTNLYVSSGDYVEKGDLIAELENNDIYDNIENQQINIEKKKLQLSELLENLDETAVYSPISGIVTKINVTEGERVSSNSILAVISDLSNLQVVIPIDELDVNKVKLGQKGVVTAEAVPDTTFNAEVTDIALEGDIQNGVATYDVTLSLNEIEGLKPGMTVNAEIITDQRKNTLLIPIEAVQQKGNEKFVLVKENEDSQLEMIPIEIGLVSTDHVEVTSGLNEGDVVVYPVASTTNSNMERKGMGMMPMGGAPAGAPKGGFNRGGK